ncbi:MAG: hypothetical protein NXI10_00635 [bacterium]|nr:hypothetical protein [bacterium]
MKLFFFIITVSLGTVLVSCNQQEHQENAMLQQMSGKWRLNRITNLEDHSYEVSTNLYSPRITIEKTDLHWDETYYEGFSTINLKKKTVGTGEYEWVEDSEGNSCYVEIMETTYTTPIAFFYEAKSPESLQNDPDRDSSFRSITLSNIHFENTHMIWTGFENGIEYEYHFSKTE